MWGIFSLTFQSRRVGFNQSPSAPGEFSYTLSSDESPPSPAMWQRKPVGAQELQHHWLVRSRPRPLRNILLHCILARDKRSRFLIAGFLWLLAVCLASGFAALIVLEAFDSDTDLWPRGAEDFALGPHDSPATAGRSVGVFSALNLMYCSIVSAGAHLVVGHRARSTLPAESSLVSISVNLAEPWGSSLTAAPVLGHFFCGRSGDDRKGAGWE